MTDLKRLRFLKRGVMLFMAAAIAWFWYSGMMLHHVWDSPFHYKGTDLTYWLTGALGLPELIMYNYTSALVFSSLLFLAFILSAVFDRNLHLCRVAGILLLLYQVLLNMRIGYHTHHLYGLQFALLPFYFGPVHFGVSAAFARVLACLTYLFAGLFKLKGGAWMLTDSFANTLQNQHAAYLYLHPSDLRSEVVFWLIGHPMVSWLVFVLAMLLQLSFAAGLLSRRFDLWLASFIIGFHAMDWFLMNLGVFMAMCAMVWLFLLPVRDWEADHERSLTALFRKSH